MKVFYSWQSDLNHETHLTFIREALGGAIAHAGLELELDEAERPMLDDAGMERRGAENIVSVIHAKIAKAAVFVADITPIATSDRDKLLPNPNVIYELGWATAQVGYDRIILVMNIAEGYKIKDMPFDLVQRPIITYSLKKGANANQRRKALDRLTGSLTDAIKTNLVGHIWKTEQETHIRCQQAAEKDFSIWATTPMVVQTGYGQNRTLAVPAAPRTYMRIIPARWNAGVPAPEVFLKLPENLRPEALPSTARSGDSGRTPEGAVRYWMTEPSTTERHVAGDAAHYFEANGEIWTIASTLWRGNKGIGLELRETMRAWKKALSASNAFMDQNGASTLRKVEAGITGLLGAHLPIGRGYNTAQSIKSHIQMSQQLSKWDEAAQQAFLLDLLNAVMSAFSQARVSIEDLGKFTGR